MIGIVVVAAFGAAFFWQAGDVMKDRSSTITSYKEERSASTRIEAWDAAIGMIKAHPITGVGFASFGQAFPSFSDKEPRVAHNTFFQIAAEWGVLAGIAYLILMLSTINRLRIAANALRAATTPEARFLSFMAEACFLGLIGFLVCALFLSLQQFELLYYVLLLANSTLVLAQRELPAPATREPSRKTRRRPAATRAVVEDARSNPTPEVSQHD